MIVAVSAASSRKSLTGPAGIVVDILARQAWVNDNAVELSALGFGMLCLLIERTGEVVTTDDLAQLVWGHERAGEPSYIHTAVYRLRTALGVAGATELIRNVRGVGYTLIGERRFNDLVTEQPILEATLRAAQTPHVLVSLEFNVNLANQAAADILGYEVSELESMPARAVLAPPDQVGDRLRMAERMALKREPVYAEEFQVVQKDGEVISVDADVSPIMLHGTVAGLLIEFRRQ